LRLAYRRLAFNQRDTLDVFHHLFEHIPQVLGFDIHGGMAVFILPVELTAHGEDAIVKLVRLLFCRLLELVVVNGVCKDE
jgi:hypothetical protein